MALILAIEPDPRQAAQITGIARHRLNAELILADTTEQALDAIGDRVPDLMLVPALLSPQDDAALAAALRVIATAANVRMLTIPVLASAAPRSTRRTVFGRWRRSAESTTTDGCDPAVFAEQVSTYLAEAIAERAARQPEPSIEPAVETPIGDKVVFDPIPSTAFESTSGSSFDVYAAAIAVPTAAQTFDAPVSALFVPDEPQVEPAAMPVFEAPAAVIVTPTLASTLEAPVETMAAAPETFEAPAAAGVDAADVFFAAQAPVSIVETPIVETMAEAVVAAPEPTTLEAAAEVFEQTDRAAADAPAWPGFESAAETTVEPPAFERALVEPAPLPIGVEPAAAMTEPAEWAAIEATTVAEAPTDALLEYHSEPVAAAEPIAEPIAETFAEAITAPIAETLSEPIADSIHDDIFAPAVVRQELAAEEPSIAAEAVADEPVVEQIAETEPAVFAFEAAAAADIVDNHDIFADLMAADAAEEVAQQAVVEASETQESIDEEAAILAEFLGAPAGTDATILAFPPSSARIDKTAVDAFEETSLDDDLSISDLSASLQNDASFDGAEAASDIIEIDLSDETLGHVEDQEPVFELNADDGDGAFALGDLPSSFAASANLAPDAPVDAPVDEAVARFVDINVDAQLAHAGFEEPQVELEADFTSDLELWMPLSVGAAHLWPVIEGVASEYVDPFATPAVPPAPPKSEHPEWTELIASLRQDMERRREGVEPTPITRVVPRRKAAKPVQDEWGFFDPQQCGFAALLAKLDEITESNEEPASRLA